MSEVTHAGRPVVEERRTTLGLYVTAKEAFDMWQADPERLRILDVRTPEEWVFVGHAPMAVNVPVAFMAYVWDEEKHGYPWELNPDFVELVQERFATEDTILVSFFFNDTATTEIYTLAAADYRNAYNILDGMEGSKVDDPDSVFYGMRLKNGWKASGLPWTYDLDPERMALPARTTGRLHAGNAED
jgi:rhodanese-related sulfurtransferase